MDDTQQAREALSRLEARDEMLKKRAELQRQLQELDTNLSNLGFAPTDESPRQSKRQAAAE